MRTVASVDSFDDTSKAQYEHLSSKWFVVYFNWLERFGRWVFTFWMIA
jgi:hypothetical protein